MAAGRPQLCSSKAICLILLIYLTFYRFLGSTKETLSTHPLEIDILCISNATSRPSMDFPFQPTVRSSTKQQMASPSSRQIFKTGCFLAQKTALAFILIQLANDVSTNPGPATANVTRHFTLDNFTRSRGLKVAHLNIRSLEGKLDSLKLLLADKPLDILTISETWLKPHDLDNEISIPGYSCVRNDRTNYEGGGTMAYVRDGIPYRLRTDLISATSESCVIEITRPKAKKLIIWTIYRAPEGSVNTFIDDLNRYIQNLEDNTELILLGDYNIKWNPKDNAERSEKRKLSNLAYSHGLEQLINEPTRVTESTATIIDMIFTNSKHRIVDSGVIHLGLSDHFMIFCVFKAGIVNRSPPKTIEYRSFKSYNKTQFIQDLRQVDWSYVDNEENIDSSVTLWNKLFLNIANMHAPVKRLRVKGTKLPWMTTHLSEAMHERDFFHKKALRSNSTRYWNLYKKARNNVNAEVRKCKSEYYSRLINENKHNHSALWKTLNEVTSRKQSSSISCIESDGVVLSDDQSIATTLNDYFASIGVSLAAKLRSYVQSHIPPNANMDSDPPGRFHFSPISEEFVRNELKKLKTNKATGLDRTSARLLKDSSNYISKSLTSIFNRSLTSGTFPSLWKQGKVTALFKSGDRLDCNNYRPITVLPTLSKILERAIHQQVYGYLEEHNILTSKQFGFRPRLSTTTALTHLSDTILQNLDKGKMTGAVFLDLSKAFDTVDHSLLMDKLKSIGMDTQALSWFKSYLANRQISTSVGSTLSTPRHIPVGVPQGSILGPLLFILYVNSLPSCLKFCDVAVYADDTVIYYSGSSAEEISEALNADLRQLSSWFKSNLLTLNATKSKFMLFGNNRSPKYRNVQDLSIVIDVDHLERVESFKYLGVTIHQCMSWSEHIDSLSKKVNQRLGIIRRVKYLLPMSARITLYNTLVVPLLDYADVIWGDKNNETIMNQLQILQNRAAKIILNRPKDSSASEALQLLNFETLAVRRKKHRAIYMYRIVNNLINFDFNIFSRNRDIHSYNTRGNTNFRLPRVKTNWGKQTVLYHAASEWNTLPENIRDSNTLAIFKSHL